ncbi:MAG TPA: hypothetical protein VFK05_31510, partial [Polyangiaceae bacterium]|nr:hypothetical protein [Polyangiaceae bacterium]
GASGKSGGSNAGAGGAIENGPLAPTIEITTPSAVADPNQGDVITASQVVVTCHATASTKAGAKKVVPASVRIQMLDTDGAQIGPDGNVHSTQVPDEYAASFTITDVPNGAVSFKCSATDESVPPNLGSTTLSTFIDHGPLVALEKPEPASAYPISPAILFQFSAAEAPLSKKDKKAGVTSVSLSVNGVSLGDVTDHELAGTPSEYRLSVDLSDPALFTPPPTGSVPVRIVATNQRGVTRMRDFSFNVDNLGPVIQIVSPPTPNQFIGGKVTLSFTVTDMPAGVATETVTVLLNNTPFIYSKDDKNWTHPSDSSFTYTFDTKNFDSAIQLTVNIRADDLAGNAAKGAAIQYYLDNAPPTIDMAPPPLQERRFDSPTKMVCSEAFLPLGKDQPQDLGPLKTVARFRALIWDEGNHAQGQHTVYFSDIDNDKSNTNTIPHLYFQTDPSKPLLKYSDATKHGQVCNAIADETLPFVTLVPITPTGAVLFPSDAPSYKDVCEPGTDDPKSPKPPTLCGGNSDLTRVIQHELALTTPAVPVIYGLTGDGAQCTGADMEVTNFANKDGWICAAVTAIDRTGNRAVSAPLRLCLDSDLIPGTPTCANSSVEAPSCVDDCIAPPHFAPGIIDRPH